MINIEKKEKCCGCYGCYNICPKNAITMTSDSEGFEYPVVDKNKCINCGLCEKVCPSFNKKNVTSKKQAYAAYNLNYDVRNESSSGGIFSLLAEKILEKNGIVFGATFDSNFMVHHIAIKSVKDLEKLRTSKYVQSKIENTYRECKKELDNKKIVLFTGTPCQINGLYSYLQKNYENLYTQDIICHGVPSPKIWKKYLEYRRKTDKNQPLKINFRYKDDSWNLYKILLKYKDTAYKIEHKNDLFMKTFLGNVGLRNSCYNCSFRGKNRISDITLADFWGIDNICPEMNDNKGTSLVVINSERGNELFNSLKDQIYCKNVNFEESIKYNTAMYESPRLNKNRSKFFEQLDNMEFDKLVEKYATLPKENLLKRVFHKLKFIFNKNKFK